LSTTNSGIDNAPSKTTDTTNIGAIVGGVLGGIAFLALLALLVFYFLRRQRRAELEKYATSSTGLHAIPGFVEPFNIHSTVTSSTTHLQPGNGVVNENGRPVTSGNEPSSAGHDGMGNRAVENAESSSESHSMVHGQAHGHAPPNLPAGERFITDATSPAEPTPVGRLGEEMTERQTFYTLPSYNEQMLRRGEGRDLSEADINAISRRLREMMRAHQSEQAGSSSNGGDGRGAIVPQELVDNLVNERLRERRDQ
jgi:hypothetical protein